jgi:CDP-glycerol glycerophosphotransferase (TagB/SpsB family)
MSSFLKSAQKSAQKAIYMQAVKLSAARAKKRGQGTSDARSARINIVYLLDFPRNDNGFIESLVAMSRRLDFDFVLCFTRRAENYARTFEKSGVRTISLDDQRALFSEVIPLLQSARVVIADNYFAFMGALEFDDRTEVIQLWHATGAIKRFGLDAKEADSYSTSDLKRYKDAYSCYTRVVVASEKMATVWKASWAADEAKMLKAGRPATDELVRVGQTEHGDDLVALGVGDRKVVLYAPTFRKAKHQPDSHQKASLHDKAPDIPAYVSTKMPAFMPDLIRICEELESDTFFIARLHPADADLAASLMHQANTSGTQNLWIDDGSISAVDLLAASDILISDYSSIVFDYELCNPSGKTILYCPDLESYSGSVGLQDDFLHNPPGELICDEEALRTSLKRAIAAHDPSSKGADKEAGKPSGWNQYNDGKSSERLLSFIEDALERREA